MDECQCAPASIHNAISLLHVNQISDQF